MTAFVVNYSFTQNVAGETLIHRSVGSACRDTVREDIEWQVVPL